ncbi:hypothetical protein GQR58_000112 [Nymphon striatum]|nr:hypothetical protein GQR58_000112 [Nymphon striatum]
MKGQAECGSQVGLVVKGLGKLADASFPKEFIDVPDRGLGVYDGVGVIDVTSNGDRVLRAIGDALPVLRMDGRTMAESAAICEYLEEAFPEPSLMPRSEREPVRGASSVLSARCRMDAVKAALVTEAHSVGFDLCRVCRTMGCGPLGRTLIAHEAADVVLPALEAQLRAPVPGEYDAAFVHVLGRVDAWNAEAARMGLELLARRRVGTGDRVSDTAEGMASVDHRPDDPRHRFGSCWKQHLPKKTRDLIWHPVIWRVIR